MGSRVPRRDEVENSESRGGGRTLYGAAVCALLTELDIQQGDEDRREDQHDDEGCSEGNHGSGHDSRLILRV